MRFEFIGDEHIKQTFLKKHEISKALLAKVVGRWQYSCQWSISKCHLFADITMICDADILLRKGFESQKP